MHQAALDGISGSSDVSVGGSFASFAFRQSGVFCSVAAGGGEDFVPDRVEDPPQPGPGSRARGVSTWADVAHSPIRFICRRAVAVERGLSGIALLGEWCMSGQRPGVAKPVTAAGPVWRTSRPSQSLTRRDRPRQAVAPASL